MLQQEINLYRHYEETSAHADFLIARRFWIFNAIVVISLLIIYFFSIFQLFYMRHREKNLEITLAKSKDEFNKIKSGMPQLFFNKDVNEAVKSMRSEVAAQKKIIEILSRNVPFSKILTALSEAIIPDVWLSSISIQKNGEDIILKGNTIGTKVDEFLDSIEKNKLFTSYHIKLDEVKNSNTESQDIRLSFVITLVKSDDK
jgi:hypothetical protein